MSNSKFINFSSYEIDYLNNSSPYSETNQNFFRKEEINIIQPLTISANISTYKKNYLNLLEMLKSIEGQFDVIRIYLNDFEEVPKELYNYKTFLGNDISDSGLFFWLSDMEEYYFTLSDNKLYPKDYVSRTIPLIKDNLVCYGGFQLCSNTEIPNLIRVDTRSSEQSFIQICDLDTLSFNTKFFRTYLWKIPLKNITHLIISLESIMYDKKIICLKHDENWIKTINQKVGLKLSQYDENRINLLRKIIQIWSNKLDEKYKAISFNDDSSGKIIDLVSKFDFKNIYHVNCSDGEFIFKMSQKFQNCNCIGLETVTERFEYCSSNFVSKNLQFEIGSLDFEFNKESLIISNDFVFDIEDIEHLWEFLPESCYLLTTKFIGQMPMFRLILNSESGLELPYYIFKK